ncbi:MAG: uroporphyrinogen-III synthase, partial [Planctomycetales bacterium]
MSDEPANFNGLRVAAFESRRAEETLRMLERLGATAFVSPSMREVPLEENQEAVDFAQRLIQGEFDLVVFLTGVGIRHLVAAVEGQVDRQAFLDALSSATTVVRGPKPAGALRELGITPTHLVAEPNTWRETLSLLDAKLPVANRNAAVQEYGLPNPHLIAGLEARGAKVTRVRVYQWELPEDLAPLEANVRRIVAGEVDLMLFTSSPQVIHLLQVAQRMNLEPALRQAIRKTVVASVGPSTSETLREQGLAVDLEPKRPKLAPLINLAAER